MSKQAVNVMRLGSLVKEPDDPFAAALIIS
jgi:hypothetical protein